MRERDLHDAFAAWLRKLEIPFIHHRMDRKSGIQVGWPDFSVLWMGRVLCVEMKTPAGKLSEDQERVIAHIRKNGCRVVVARSCEEAVEACKDILCVGKPDPEANNRGKGLFKAECAELKHAVAAVGRDDGNIPGKGKAEPQPFGIASWGGTNVVLARDTDGGYRKIRNASDHDVLNLPKVA